MLRERIAVASDVVSHLNEAERSNDLAIAATARLAACMVEARLKLNAAVPVGHEAFEAVASTFSQQATSRRLLVDAHAALDSAKRLVGLGEVALGGAGDKEVPAPTGNLRVVESAAA